MERVRCPAPLPEDSVDAVLTRMLAPTPYQVSMKEGKNNKTGGDPFPRDKSDTMSGEIKVSSPKDKGAREANIPSPHGKKRAISEAWEEKSPKRQNAIVGRLGLGKRHRRTVSS